MGHFDSEEASSGDQRELSSVRYALSFASHGQPQNSFKSTDRLRNPLRYLATKGVLLAGVV